MTTTTYHESNFLTRPTFSIYDKHTFESPSTQHYTQTYTNYILIPRSIYPTSTEPTTTNTTKQLKISIGLFTSYD
jgi:hypothetical protein